MARINKRTKKASHPAVPPKAESAVGVIGGAIAKAARHKLKVKAPSDKPEGNGAASHSRSHKPEGNGAASHSRSHKTRRVLRKAVVKKKPAAKTFASHPAVPPKAESAVGVIGGAIAAAIAKATGEPGKPEAAAAREMPVSRIEKAELPSEYGKDMIVLQVRDPWWLHAYWEVRAGTLKRLKDEFLALFDTARKALRVYDVSFIDFNGSNAHRYFDIELTRDCLNWYIDTGATGRSWCVDLGLKLSDGRFITIARSNTVTTPLDGPSWITDEEWMVPDELFTKLYATAVGLGGSPVKIKKPWLELQKRRFASGGISSLGISPVRKNEELKRKFWLSVNTELIVHGAAEPDTKVTVAGSPISLRSDGTFSLRFALPDGKQVIPVHAKSSDGIDERTVTPVVTKETK